VLSVFTKAATVGAYAWVWEHGRLATLDASSPWTWVLCFLGVDFFYYWFHRVSHVSNLPWGAHIVHHQSEEFNLSVALRQSAFQPLFSFVFYLPLALAGFPPLVFLACSSFDTLYQFWIHTRTIGKLGPLEWVLNTPSHHRVHHGRDPIYIDKNYAGTLIVWDRLFGTFQEEIAEPDYGITKPLRSWNPLWANVHHWVDLVRASRRAPSWREVARLWRKGPAWKPAWADSDDVDPAAAMTTAPRYDARPGRALTAYALANYLVVIAATVYLLFVQEELGRPARYGLALLIVWSVATIGAMFDGSRWLKAAEIGRLGAVGAFAALALSD
jgi:hypothetical protein